MCKHFHCDWSEICVKYGGSIDIVTGIVLWFLKEHIIPLSKHDIHEYIATSASIFLITKGSFLLVASRTSNKLLKIAILTYLISTTLFLILAKVYLVLCAIDKFAEAERDVQLYKKSGSVEFHFKGPVIVTFILVCPTVFLIMWHLQLYLFLFTRRINTTRRL